MSNYKQAYLQRIMPYAEREAQRLGTHPAFIASQMALENNWGKSILPGTYNHGNVNEHRKNVAGVYANDAGNRRKFRIYANDSDFFDSYGGLLSRRYKGTMGAKDIYQFANALKAGGYAEDPRYVSSMANVYNQFTRLMPNYQWNGKATLPIPVQPTNGTMANMQGVAGGYANLPVPNAGQYQMTDSKGVQAQPTALDQTVKVAQVPQHRLPTGNIENDSLETLSRMFGGNQKNSFWRS